MDYMQALERLGIPMFVLIMVGFGLWKGCVWLSVEVIKPIAIAHIEWINEAKICNMKNSETLEKIGQILETKATAIAKIAEHQLEMSKILKKESSDG